MDEILEVAIANSKHVLDIEHLEGRLPRIYGTIFPMNLKPMTTSEFEAVVLMNWLAMDYANVNCRNKNKLPRFLPDWQEELMIKLIEYEVHCTRYWSYYTELSDMLNSLSYYRRVVENCSLIAAPVVALLLSGEDKLDYRNASRVDFGYMILQ
ncbi:hypothetical protein L2E82_16226 [Cichorium intybus]|uniref:Uncharacterized protein n=1 Tax=Cichorium intybus TaxID=13427 RepID=A0ACB9F5I3_CICIN|nr:hypothetical protein L2E82_16226 [Cichorium intybus]